MNWLIKKTNNCILYFSKNSLAEKNIDSLIVQETEAINKVCRFLNVTQPSPLNVYLFPSLSFKKKLYGGSSPGHSSYKDNAVGYVYNKSCLPISYCHEETHIYCMLWGGKQVKLEGKLINSLPGLYEGIAMYTQSALHYPYFYRNKQLPPPKGMTINQGIMDDIKNNKAPRIFDVLMYDGYCKNLKNGAQLGSIAGYLIDTFGLEIFRKIYLTVSEQKSLKDNIQVFEQILNLSSSKINNNWKNYAISNFHFKKFEFNFADKSS